MSALDPAWRYRDLVRMRRRFTAAFHFLLGLCAGILLTGLLLGSVPAMAAALVGLFYLGVPAAAARFARVRGPEMAVVWNRRFAAPFPLAVSLVQDALRRAGVPFHPNDPRRWGQRSYPPEFLALDLPAGSSLWIMRGWVGTGLLVLFLPHPGPPEGTALVRDAIDRALAYAAV